jgi:hypothetical protein
MRFAALLATITNEFDDSVRLSNLHANAKSARVACSRRKRGDDYSAALINSDCMQELFVLLRAR